MSRKGNRGKRRIREPDHTAWAFAIARASEMDPKVADDSMLKLHVSYQAMRDGTGDDDDFDRLASALNVGLIRAEAIGEPAVQVMLAARGALLEADRRRGEHGRYGFSGADRTAMTEGLELYEQILRSSTPAQMQAALAESVRRMRVQVAEHRAAGREVADARL